MRFAAVAGAALRSGASAISAGWNWVAMRWPCDEPGCRSTCTELLPGRTVRCASPATTSTSSGGKHRSLDLRPPEDRSRRRCSVARRLRLEPLRFCFGLPRWPSMSPAFATFPVAGVAEQSQPHALCGRCGVCILRILRVRKPEIAILDKAQIPDGHESSSERDHHHAPLLGLVLSLRDAAPAEVLERGASRSRFLIRTCCTDFFDSNMQGFSSDGGMPLTPSMPRKSTKRKQKLVPFSYSYGHRDWI